MGEPEVLERVKVREVTGVFPSRDAANPAVDDLLLSAFNRADIDAVAEGEPVRRRIDDIAVQARDLADVPEAPRPAPQVSLPLPSSPNSSVTVTRSWRSPDPRHRHGRPRALARNHDVARSPIWTFFAPVPRRRMG